LRGKRKSDIARLDPTRPPWAIEDPAKVQGSEK